MRNRSSNFKLQFRSPAIAAIRSQSRETRRGERQCHSESRVAATTLQHLVLYLINCYMNSVHLRDFISLFSRYSCGEVRIYRKVINNRSTYLIKIYLLSFLNSILSCTTLYDAIYKTVFSRAHPSFPRAFTPVIYNSHEELSDIARAGERVNARSYTVHILSLLPG